MAVRTRGRCKLAKTTMACAWPQYHSADRPSGIVAKLTRAMVVGPIARLELLPLDAASVGSNEIIEAHIGAQQYAALALKEGETVLLRPRRARVFVAQGEGI